MIFMTLNGNKLNKIHSEFWAVNIKIKNSLLIFIALLEYFFGGQQKGNFINKPAIFHLNYLVDVF